MPSKNLFLFIKSLTQVEKRYFRLFASEFHKGKPINSERLFDAINGQEEYDEKAIKKKFSGDPMGKNLAVEKNYLYSILLKCLRQFHSGWSVTGRIKDLLRDAENLYEKGLYGQCDKLLCKAKKMSYAYGKYGLLMEVFRWEKKLFYTGVGKQRLVPIIEEEQKALRLIEQISEYDMILGRIVEIRHHQGIARNIKEMEALDKLMQHPLLKSDSNANSFDVKMRYYNIFALFYRATMDYRNGYLLSRKWVELLEQRTERIEESPFNYITALHHFLTCVIRENHDEEFYIALEKLKEIPVKYYHADTLRIKAFVFVNYHLNRMLFYNLRGVFDKSIEVMPEMEKQLEKCRNVIDQQLYLELCLQATNGYFGIGDYPKSLLWLRKIVSERASNIRADIHCVARILLLIVEFDYGKKDVTELERMAKSTEHYLKKRNQMYHLESVLLDFFKNDIPDIVTKQDFQKAFFQLHERLEELKSSSCAIVEMNEYFDFFSWIESRVKGLHS